MALFWRYILNVLIAIDQLGNALAGGDPDETISSRCAKAMRRAVDKGVPAPRFWCALAWFLEAVDPGHLKRTIEPDEGADAVIPYARAKE